MSGPESDEIARQAMSEQEGQIPREPGLVERVSRYYPIPGEFILREIHEAEWKDLPRVVDEFLAIKEGLFFGAENWDLEDKQQLLFLYNLFTTVEGASERQSFGYPEQELDLRLQGRAFELKRKAIKEGSLGEEEIKEITEIARMENMIRARAEFDMAFIQRMDTCEVGEVASELLGKDSHYRKSVKPDRGVWQSLFSDSGEFGESVDRVLRRVVVAGTPTGELEKLQKSRTEIFNNELQPLVGLESDIYVREIGKIEIFKEWLSDLLKTANGRMDVVWTAWRLALVWEIPSELGVTVRDGEYKIADPPIGNDFFTWAMHINEKRAIEFGLSADGSRNTPSKYLTHSGYPLSLGKIPEILGSYLHESDIYAKTGKTDKEGKPITEKMSLWKLWWDKGVKLSEIEWFKTDIDPQAGTDPFPPASYGGWLLKRTRAWPVITDLRSRPSFKEISDPDFFAKRARSWGKIFGTYRTEKEELTLLPERRLTPEKNPRAWWVAGILLAHHRIRNKDIPIVNERGEDFAYRTYLPDEAFGTSRKGEGERRPPSVAEILDHAEQSGFLRPVDITWIRSKLNIKVAVM